MGVGGGRVPLGWPATAAVHRSQWKFIFLIGHISFIVRLDSMLKLIRNYINQNGFAVQGPDFERDSILPWSVFT
jgi:hypothetical protein